MITGISYGAKNITKLCAIIQDVIGLKVDAYIIPKKDGFLDDYGYAVKEGNFYQVFVKPEILKSDKITNFVIRLFIHELWHLKQMSENHLTFNSNRTVAFWNGKEYTNDIAHGDREWEIEAKRMETKYFKQVKERL